MNSKIIETANGPACLRRRNNKKLKSKKIDLELISKFVSSLIKKNNQKSQVRHIGISPNTRRAISPMNLQDLKRRIISPNARRNIDLRQKKSITKAQMINPLISEKMFIDYSDEQIQMLDKLSNKVAEAKTYHCSGLKSPRLLLRILHREKHLIPTKGFQTIFQTNQMFQNTFHNIDKIQLFRIDKLQVCEDLENFEQKI